MSSTPADPPSQPVEKPTESPLVGGRYRLYKTFATGGMGEVRLGEIVGARGFHRVVAVKCVRPEFAMDQAFTTMLHDEANIVSRIRHANVVPVLDLLEDDGLYLVMEYIHGEPLSRLVVESSRRGEMVPAHIAIKLVVDMLEGLHAAHDAKSITGEPLNVVHRDISPQNLLVGIDGVGRVLDFGIAKAVGRSRRSREGELKGKMAYMAPEQLRGENATKETDIYAAAIVLWEMLAGRRYHMGLDQTGIVNRTIHESPLSLTMVRGDLSSALDALITQGLAKNPARRFSSAQAMANALRGVAKLATPNEVGRLVGALAKDILSERARMLEDIDRRHTKAPPPMAPRKEEEEEEEENGSPPPLTDVGAALPHPFPPLPPPVPASQSTVRAESPIDPSEITANREAPAAVAALARHGFAPPATSALSPPAWSPSAPGATPGSALGSAPAITDAPPLAPGVTMKGAPAPAPSPSRVKSTVPFAPAPPTDAVTTAAKTRVAHTAPLSISPAAVTVQRTNVTAPFAPPVAPPATGPLASPAESAATRTSPIAADHPELVRARAAIAASSSSVKLPPSSDPSPPSAPSHPGDLAPPSLVLPRRASTPDANAYGTAPEPTGPITIQRQGFIGAPMWDAPPAPQLAPWGVTPPKPTASKSATSFQQSTTALAILLFLLVASGAFAFCMYFPG